jgi:hypothetical protein
MGVPMPTTDTHPEPSLVEIIKNLRNDALTLFRQEINLAKREMAEKFSRMGKNAVFLGIGAVIGLYCVFFLLLGINNLIQAGLIAAGLSGSMSAWLAPLILGVVLGAAAGIFAMKALRVLSHEKPLPEQTLETLREDKDWAKGKLK